MQDNHRGGTKSQSKTQETTDRVKQEIAQKINTKHRDKKLTLVSLELEYLKTATGIQGSIKTLTRTGFCVHFI